jgi:hypothetical protein
MNLHFRFSYQQNLDKILFTIILLDTSTLLWKHQSLFAPKIVAFMNDFVPTLSLKIVYISIDGFVQGKKRDKFRRVFSPEQIRFI